MSSLEAKRALFSFPMPINCPTITLPPVPNAENRETKKTCIVLKQLTPLTAASPACETIIVSAIPTVTERRVSIKRG